MAVVWNYICMILGGACRRRTKVKVYVQLQVACGLVQPKTCPCSLLCGFMKATSFVNVACIRNCIPLVSNVELDCNFYLCLEPIEACKNLYVNLSNRRS